MTWKAKLTFGNTSCFEVSDHYGDTSHSHVYCVIHITLLSDNPRAEKTSVCWIQLAPPTPFPIYPFWWVWAELCGISGCTAVWQEPIECPVCTASTSKESSEGHLCSDAAAPVILCSLDSGVCGESGTRQGLLTSDQPYLSNGVSVISFGRVGVLDGWEAAWRGCQT